MASDPAETGIHCTAWNILGEFGVQIDMDLNSLTRKMSPMRKWAVLLLLWGFAWPAMAAKIMSIDQMEQLLSKLHGEPDRKVADGLGDVQLTERVSLTRLMRWEAEFPGPSAHEQLMKLADLSAFLKPPAADVLPDPRPDMETQQHMLWMAVQYVRNTTSQLPNFLATRETTHLESTPSPSDTFSGMGDTPTLQATSVYSRTVTYRGGHEVLEGEAGKPEKESAFGLFSHGEFGPILAQILSDALLSQVNFLRWEQGPSGRAAVFDYTVPENASHFRMVTTIGNASASVNVNSFNPAYHGEIEIDSGTGAILRLSEIADVTPPRQDQRAAIMVEYAPVTIGGHGYICPVRSVAFSKIRVPIEGANGKTVNPTAPYSWPIQTYLNDVAFTGYHEFRSESRIVGDQSDTSR
jgi:hypothetical protein